MKERITELESEKTISNNTNDDLVQKISSLIKENSTLQAKLKVMQSGSINIMISRGENRGYSTIEESMEDIQKS